MRQTSAAFVVISKIYRPQGGERPLVAYTINNINVLFNAIDKQTGVKCPREAAIARYNSIAA